MRTATTATRAAGRFCACRSDYSRLVELHSQSFFRCPSHFWTGFLFSTTNLMLKIALPNKGRLADDTRELFGDAGLPVLSRGDRALSASLGGEFEALFVRAQDIPEFVADGVADVGVTGWDLVCESRRPVERRLDLGFGECRLIAAAREDSVVRDFDDIPVGARVATSFPNVTREFFQGRSQNVEIVPISGAAEIAPLLGIAEIIVDITSTGSTLKVNGLREIGTLLTSRAQLVTRCDSVVEPAKTEALDSLIMALDSVVRARGKRYLMANVPRKALDAVKKVIPGINGPTVIDILNGGDRVAVHAVVDAATVFRTIGALKALDASGILVTRVERLMP
jgi:ATP phosphoribosyltransferase